jgi:aminoglycoside phosphotransferase (APT) family kinase protein
MPPLAVTAEAAASLAREVLGGDPTVEHLPVGYGNQNWRVASAGRRYVLKLGPPDLAAKWTASRRAYDLAAGAGVPVPELVHFAVRSDAVVRVFTWVDGASPATVADRPGAAVRFGADLGAAVGALHAVTPAGYSSRLDGSAPAFARWADYVGHRLGQVRDRARRNATLDAATFDRAGRAIAALAGEVDGRARLVLAHRDLHADNLVAGEDGRLLAVLDWDMAEAWDAAAEWFKLDGLLFPAVPGAADPFWAAYRGVHPGDEAWDQRARLVDLLESLNVLANGVSDQSSPAWVDWGRDRLDRLLVPRH